MSRLTKLVLALCLLPSLLTGCWDIKDLQEINYLTAVGFDLEGGEYVIYGQLLDFASVAKAESGKSESLPIWVGKGRGKTLVHAIDDLYRTSQLRVFYGHVNALVIGERLLKDKQALIQVEQFQGRFYEMRYTPWMFGTSEPIGDLFSATSIIGLSPNVSILHQPLETYRQRSIVRPISIREFAMEMNEPGHTTILPSIALSDKSWSKGNKKQELFKINGAYAMKDDGFLGWFPVEELQGLTWVEPAANRGPLVLSLEGEAVTALNLEKPKVSIQPRVQGDRAEYSIDVELTGTLLLSMKQIAESELERQAEQRIQKQIRELYSKGLKHNADLLNLKTAMYRKKNREWKMLQSRNALALTPESLTEINVTVNLKRAGNMKSQARLE